MLAALVVAMSDFLNPDDGPAPSGEFRLSPTFLIVLLGLGLRTFSVAPPMLPEIKKIIRSVTIKDAEEIAAQAVKLGDTRKTAEYLKAETRKILPDAT